MDLVKEAKEELELEEGYSSRELEAPKERK
jgi:hypothetical protein